MNPSKKKEVNYTAIVVAVIAFLWIGGSYLYVNHKKFLSTIVDFIVDCMWMDTFLNWEYMRQ